MTIKIGSAKYRLTVRHVIEVRISESANRYVYGEGRSKCHSSDEFNVWTGIRQAIAAALDGSMGRSWCREKRAAFWEQALYRFGVTERKPLLALQPVQLYVPPATHGILRALAEPVSYDPNVEIPPAPAFDEEPF